MLRHPWFITSSIATAVSVDVLGGVEAADLGTEDAIGVTGDDDSPAFPRAL